MADFSALCEGTLISQLATSTTSNVTVQLKKINNLYSTVTWPTGAHEIMIVRETEDGIYAERCAVASGTTQSNTTGVVTLGTLTRNCSLTDGTDTTGTSATITWPPSTKVYVTWGIRDADQTAFKSEANTFLDHQTLTTTKELRFNSSATAIWKDGSGNLSLKDANTATQTLSGLAAAAGTDHKVLNTANDTTADYLFNKLAAGAGITVTETNDGGDEDTTIAAVNTVATGHTGLSTITSGGIPVGAGTSNMTVIGPGTLGQVPVSNGTTIAMGSPVLVYSNTADSNDISTGTSYSNFDKNYTIPAAALVAGAVYKLVATGTWDGGVNGRQALLGVRFGTTALLEFVPSNPTGSTVFRWRIEAEIICRSTGASGSVQASGTAFYEITSSTSILSYATNTVTTDTTGTNLLTVSNKWNVDDGSKSCILKNIYITRLI
jgi:hypothetical protein